MAKGKSTKGQTMIYKSLHTKTLKVIPERVSRDKLDIYDLLIDTWK